MYRQRQHLWVRLLLAGLIAAVGCGEVSTLESGALTEADGGADTTAMASDASLGGDLAGAAQTDTSAQQIDTAGESDAVADVATSDISALDAMASGDAQPDSAATDAQVADTAAPDTSAPDTSAPAEDATTYPCKAPRAAFDAARAKAFACNSPFVCYAKALTSPDCTCQAFANGTNQDNLTALSIAASDVKKAKCTEPCAADCADLSKTVGQCVAGTCETTSPSCAELDALFQQALAAGSVCSADSDCTFKASNTLACGCAAFVNTSKMGPGTPLFSFVTMLVGAYKAKGCTTEVSCECPPAEKAACVSGKCVIKN